MLPAAQSALAALVCAFLLSQSPSELDSKQRDADRGQARQLLSRAASLIEQIEDPAERIPALWRIGLQRSIASDYESAGAAFDASIALFNALPQDQARRQGFQRTQILFALGRAGDVARAQTMINAAPDASRDSLLASFVYGFAFSRPRSLREPIDLARQINNDFSREQALSNILRSRGRTARAEDLDYLLSFLNEPANRVAAQAYLGAAKIREGNPAGDRDLLDASQLAAEVEPGGSGGGGMIGCVGPEMVESQRDMSLREVARLRLEAGHIAGALSTVEQLETAEGREDLLATIALVQGSKGDFIGAQQTAIRIGRATCRDIALEGVAYALLNTGNVASALRIARSLSTPHSRAQAFYGIGVRRLGAGDKIRRADNCR